MGCAAAAFCISKFAELVRPGVTYGRLTDNIAGCELAKAKAPDIDIEKRDLAVQPLCGSYSHAGSFTKFLKSGWRFLRAGETRAAAASYGKEQGAEPRSFYH
jgi:hypothetical protein